MKKLVMERGREGINEVLRFEENGRGKKDREIETNIKEKKW